MHKAVRSIVSVFARRFRSRKDCPDSRPTMPRKLGKIVAVPQVGGLHHRYERLAARFVPDSSVPTVVRRPVRRRLRIHVSEVFRSRSVADRFDVWIAALFT
jgi:hypothetical protein